MGYLNHFDNHGLLIAATRYWAGRCTIGAASFAGELAAAWPDVPEKTRAIIKRDLEELFDRDDRARDAGSGYKPLGMDCDRTAWEQVRRAWEGK